MTRGEALATLMGLEFKSIGRGSVVQFNDATEVVNKMAAYYEARIAEKDARIAELEAENAALKPKFEVGQEVEVLHFGDWTRDSLDSPKLEWLTAGGRIVTEDRIRLPQPKVTKPTSEEWYEAWGDAMQASGGDRWNQLYSLAFRHEATKGAGE